MQAKATEPAQGLIFGRYRPLTTTMVAGFGSTNKGFDTLAERPVTITMLKKAKVASASSKLSYSLQQMRSDAVLATKRTHPGILDIHDQLEDDQHYYVISEFTEHPSISRMPAILTKDDVFSVMEVFEKVVTVIQYLNHSGIYGCCVRQGNVFVSPEGLVSIDNVFSCRVNFIADLPDLGRELAGLAVSKGGAFMDREANQRLDLKLTGDILKSLLVLANKGQQQAQSAQTARPNAAHRSELGLAILPKINAIVGKLGAGIGEPQYASIADLAEDVRAITTEIRSATADVDSRVPLKAGGSRRSYSPGEAIFKEGDVPTEEAFIIEAGTVQILKTAVDGREIYLDVSQPGDIVGEMALIDNQPRMATARVIEPCTVAVITGTQFRNMLEKADPISRRLMNVLVRRLRYQSGEITRLKSLLGVNK